MSEELGVSSGIWKTVKNKQTNQTYKNIRTSVGVGTSKSDASIVPKNNEYTFVMDSPIVQYEPGVSHSSTSFELEQS